MKYKYILNKLIERKDLNLSESQFLTEEILKGNLAPAQISAFLIALRMKGEKEEEILGFIQVMRRHMLKVETSGVVIDTCGTGGDGAGTFNISTAAAFVVAGGGVKVAKHGNRAASSLCGSADVLEALGININLTPKRAEELLVKTNFTFLFAPLYHPAMKHVAQVRKELGIRTVFNFLGPFVSPASVKRQLIGVPNKYLAEKLAKVAAKLSYETLLVVTSEDGMDEVSLSGKTVVFEVRGQTKAKRIIDPKEYGFGKIKREEIMGGTVSENAAIIKEILAGKQGTKQDIVVFNSAFAFYVAGKAKSIEEGIILARKSISSGLAKKVLEKLIRETQKYA